MASDVGISDAEIPYLIVSPADGTTQVTLTVTAPDGTTAPVTMTGEDFEPIPDTDPVEYSQRWVATTPVTFTQAGRWVLHFDVTGTGEGAEDREVYVVASPVAGGPTWLPGRSRVAAYVPHRTLARSTSSTVGSADTYQFTFDSTTTPPGVTVDRLIADGAAWVSAFVTPMAASSEPVAAVLAALWAAVCVERSWPDDDRSLQRANDMEKSLETKLAALIEANAVASDTGSYGLEIVNPVYSFPAADCRWDYPTYW